MHVWALCASRAISFLQLFAIILMNLHKFHVFTFLNEICLVKSYKRSANCKVQTVNLYPIRNWDVNRTKHCIVQMFSCNGAE